MIQGDLVRKDEKRSLYFDELHKYIYIFMELKRRKKNFHKMLTIREIFGELTAINEM